MAEPTTKAGRALLEEPAWHTAGHSMNGWVLRQRLAPAILAVEAEARAQGKAEERERIMGFVWGAIVDILAEPTDD